MRRLLFLLVLLYPSIGLAQQHTFELTPTVGFRRAGGITIEDRAFNLKEFPVDVSSSGTYGLLFGVRLTRSFHLELLASRQAGSFDDKLGLFGEEPGGFIEPGNRDLLDVDATYYHGGLLWEPSSGLRRWYVAAGAGMAHIKPSLPLPSDTRFSFSVAGGLKMRFDEHLGFRLGGRFYWTDTDESISVVEEFTHRDCDPCSYVYSYEESMMQAELLIGLILKR